MSIRPHIRTRTSGSAFTLVEILVVIAIIAILAMIAVPAYSSITARSRSAGCLSNMRQLTSAILSFTSDNDGFLPRSNMNTDGSSSAGREWYKAVYKYIPTANNKMSGKQVNKVFLCPAAKQPPDKTTTCCQYTASFALEAGSSSTAATGSNGNGPRALGSIEYPTKTIILVDGALGNTSYAYSTESASTWNAVRKDIAQSDPTNTTKISFRHAATGAMNVAYADGHVSTIRWEDRDDTNNLSEPIWRGTGFN